MQAQTQTLADNACTRADYACLVGSHCAPSPDDGHTQAVATVQVHGQGLSNTGAELLCRRNLPRAPPTPCDLRMLCS